MPEIKSFEEACQYKGLDPQKVLPDVSGFPKEHQQAIVSHAMLIIIVAALNENWKPDWNDMNEEKWYPWFDMEKTESNPSGFGLCVAHFVHTFTFVGSRLCFRTRALAQYVGTQFSELYKSYMVLE